MGGNALKNTKTRRYQRDEYYLLELKVILKLMAAFPNRFIEPINAYADKESFGDMDILMMSNDIKVNVRDVLQATFSPNEIVKNGNCYSFDFEELQVDLILTPKEFVETSRVYFSYNDLGNLMGRIYHQMGLKYGHEGLTYAIYDDEDDHRVLDVIRVSQDHYKIFAIAGYSFERWRQGFKNLEEVFEFAVDTPYFNYGIFDLENRNHRSRIRDRKRPTYTKFLEWAKDKPARYEWGDMTDKVVDRKAFLPRINQFFPDFQAKYDAVMEAARVRKHIRSLYNGQMISDITGLREKELGLFMVYLKKNVPNLEEIAKIEPRTPITVLDFGHMVQFHHDNYKFVRETEEFIRQQQEQKEVNNGGSD